MGGQSFTVAQSKKGLPKNIHQHMSHTETTLFNYFEKLADEVTPSEEDVIGIGHIWHSLPTYHYILLISLYYKMRLHQRSSKQIQWQQIRH